MKIKIEKPSKEKLQNLGIYSWPIWEKEVSTFPWEYDEKETCYILEGEARITTSDGEEVTIKEGDLVTFPKGLRCTWQITKNIRKHYAFG